MLEGHVNALPGITIDSIIWDWQVCDAANCYTSDSSVATFTNLVTTDSCSLHIYVYIIANGDTCELNIADSLVYGANGWEVLGGDLTFNSEIQPEDYIFDDRIFDLFGREYYTLKSIPFGSIYIQNGKKYIKIK